ncbi:MAG: hypothetical protein IJN50_08095 [Clostridia bacterium]|nr:hypothetical protein [Clostridia bacterium]
MKRKILSKLPLILMLIAACFLIAAGALNGSDYYTTLVAVGTVTTILSALVFLLMHRAGYLK